MPTSSDRKKYVKRTCTGEITTLKAKEASGGATDISFDKPQTEVNWNKSFDSLGHKIMNRGTKRQFSENTCSVDDLRFRIFGTFVAKFLACLPLLGFSDI